MFNLVITVMSIALAAGAVLITTSYLDPTIPIQKQSQNRVEKGFETLGLAWHEYRKANEVRSWACDTYTSPGTGDTYEDCQKVVSDPGYLPVSGWSSSLVPDYTLLPQPPKGISWSYGSSSDGWYFCAEGSMNAAQLKGAYRAETAFPVDSYFISSTCGSVFGELQENVDASNIKITYWVKRN